MAVASGQGHRERDATAVADQVVFGACATAVDRLAARNSRRHDLVQALPDAGLVPVTETAPARRARPGPEFPRQMLPADARVQHEQDASKTQAIR